MAECTYKLPFKGTAADGFAAAKHAIQQAGGTMMGTTSSGTAKIPSPGGDVSLSYKVVGQYVYVDILDKPFFVSCDVIESQLRQAIAQAQPAPKPLPIAPKVPLAPKTEVVATAPTHKVITLPVTHIEGEVPATAPTEAPLWAVVVVAVTAGLTLGYVLPTLLPRPRRRRRFA